MSYNFNPKIDRDFIISMYEDDYGYISEIFSTTLNQLEPDLLVLKQKFTEKDLEATRKLVHKIKPAFGFVGLRETETLCQQFEDSCHSATSVEDVSASFYTLVTAIGESCDIIRTEIEKLTAFKQGI